MSTIIIKIDRNINDNPQDFTYLFGIYQRFKDSVGQNIIFDFTGCKFLQQNAVAFLGALIRFLQIAPRKNTISFRMGTLNDAVKANLEKNGFLYKLGLSKDKRRDGTTIPYRIDTNQAINDYTNYLAEKWLLRGWVDLDEPIKNLVVSRVIETYINVFDHANSPIGVMTCGQYYPQKGELKLALVDFGVGIPYNVRTFLKRPEIAPEGALRWVFQSMTTTKNSYRGNGLKLLKSFIREHHGKLEIYSDSGYACIMGDTETFRDNSIGFGGTFIQISIMTDSHLYNQSFDAMIDTDEFFF